MALVDRSVAAEGRELSHDGSRVAYRLSLADICKHRSFAGGVSCSVAEPMKAGVDYFATACLS